MRRGRVRNILLHGGGGSVLVKAASTLLGFLLSVALARTLGPAEYGIYSFALAIIMLLAIPAKAGLSQLVVRETAKTRAIKDWSTMRGVWRWANAKSLLISSLIMGGCLIIIALTEPLHAEQKIKTFLAGLALIPLLALGNIRGAALSGLGNVVAGQFPELVLRPALTLLFVIAITWFCIHTTPASQVVMLLHTAAAACAFLVGAFLLRHARPDEVRNKPTPSYDGKTWQKAALPLTVLAGLQAVNINTDIVMLGVLRSDEEVGVYKVVVQLAMLIVFGLHAITQILQPHFARLHSQGKLTDLQELVTKSARVVLSLATPVALVMMVLGGEILTYLFGDPYRAGALALAILSLGRYVNAAIGSVGALLNMAGYERKTLKAIAIASLINVVLNALLIPHYGMNGAATATCITIIVWTLALRYSVKKYLAIESTVFGSHLRY